jgi:hypothetical protein
MTGMPACSSLPVTSVTRPSLTPCVTATGTATPSRSTQTWRTSAVLAPSAAERRCVVPRGGRGRRVVTRPPGPLALLAAAWAPACVGVKRSAVLGTSSTSRRSVAVMVAVAVMPGRSERSLLSTSRWVM